MLTEFISYILKQFQNIRLKKKTKFETEERFHIIIIEKVQLSKLDNYNKQSKNRMQ